MTRRVLLVARTGLHADPVGALQPAVAALAAGGTDARVAVLDGHGPTVTAALDDARADRVTDVVLVPAHLPPDRYLVAWLRRVVAHWLRSVEDAPAVHLAEPLAATGEVAAALARTATGPTTRLGTAAAPLTVPAWERVPAHRRHVLACRGPRCAALGAAEVTAALTGELDAAGLGDDDVLVTATGCLFPCARGPWLVVHPEDTWYGQLDADQVPRIVAEHLVGGRPVEAWRVPRGDPPG
ncbi:ferredoxin [uncultured Modestobacter sp.]|uniref:(2Fe-2S) ferredoxin domain-containing protein n=1 Tax=uncultured Modestobacter sp. TaxID=380048 RepID=UPI0026349405|nr:(2Fe-2S) ferredoxin domain-containing protein [uncultured Modestobacter sp.]